MSAMRTTSSPSTISTSFANRAAGRDAPRVLAIHRESAPTREGINVFRRRTSLAGLAATAALSLVVAGCGGSSSGGGGGSQASKTLTIGVITPATTFAAADIAFANESPYGQAVYDTLLKADPDGKIGPSLATEWSYNDTKTVLTMTLRSDVKFTDGTPFNADAAAQNLKRFQAGNSPNKSYLANLADAKAVDATHLQITLKQADPAMLNYLTQNAGMQESPAAFTKSDLKTNPVGSGPYVLDPASTVIGSSYGFNKNPNYWNKADQHYDKLVIKVFNDPTSMLNALKGKQINGAKLVTNDFIDQLKGTSGINLVDWELDWSGLMIFDRAGTVNPALKDVRVRQALNYAFDKQALAKAVQKGYATPTGQVFPPRSPAYDPALDTKYNYDPAKAKQLLAAAGYPNGFTLAMATSSRVGSTVFTVMAQQLKDIGVTAQYTDPGTNFITDLLARKYAANWFVLQQDPTDWQEIQFLIAPTATWNMFKYSDPKVNDLIAKIHDAKTDADAAPALKELNAYIVDQAWFAPWYRIKSFYATDANTVVVPQVGNAYPYLWNFKPKGT
jgi:peptide/nickel transport system substrate-binding protein